MQQSDQKSDEKKNDEKKSEYDLFNNPRVDMAKRAMTPEQLEEYKKIGQYMYNSTNYQELEMGRKITAPSTEELAVYAFNGVRSGLDPKELSDQEISAINKVYGKNWYVQFGYKADDIPVPMYDIVNSNDSDAIENKLKNLNMSRQQRRKLERQMEKIKKKQDKINKNG